MKCNVCGQKEANVKIVKVINGEKTVIHLCEDCAKNHGDLTFNQQGFNLSNLISDFFSSSFSTPQFNALQNNELKCSKCGLSWRGFQEHSRLGCSECYNTFKDQLLPLIRRMHGNALHQGQIPKTKQPNLLKKKQLRDKKIKLQEAILEERYEDAAKYRDEIKTIEHEIEGIKNE
jgi:protein arginine kinase activator